jgi:[ribosomal protein S5]-alanine N-acetyltransferase
MPRDYLAMADRSRVLLSHPTEADAEEFIARMRASRALHRPWLYPPLSPDEYGRYLAALGERKVGYLGRRRADGALIGYANVSEIVRGAMQGAFLSYAGVAEFGGQGYMTELLRLVLRDAFGRLRLHRLEANIQPGNAASLALVRRCGFEREGFSPRYLKIGGRWRDHERWALLRETWLG